MIFLLVKNDRIPFSCSNYDSLSALYVVNERNAKLLLLPKTFPLSYLISFNRATASFCVNDSQFLKKRVKIYYNNKTTDRRRHY
jgi:hypothetical protein